MTRHQLMQQIPSGEICEWQAYYELLEDEGFDDALTRRVVEKAAQQRKEAKRHG